LSHSTSPSASIQKLPFFSFRTLWLTLDVSIVLKQIGNFLFETWSCSVAQAVLKFVILLTQPA
jgi:hypothetical protein